jgi:hypothetical protein
MKRREFPDAIKAKIVHRAMNAAGWPVCERCGAVLKKNGYEIDHIIAEALVVDKSKPLTAEDGQLLGKECCHRGEDGKTNKDVKVIAKAKRNERNFLGFAPRTRNLIPGSKGTRWKKTFNHGTVPR